MSGIAIVQGIVDEITVILNSWILDLVLLTDNLLKVYKEALVVLEELTATKGRMKYLSRISGLSRTCVRCSGPSLG